MLTRGIVPVMDVDDPRGQVVVNVQLCDKGVWFNWDWEVVIDRPRFDGAVRKFAGFVVIGRRGCARWCRVRPWRCQVLPPDLLRL